MLDAIFNKVLWVGKATVFCVGLAVVLALVLGIATAALAAVPGDPFRLGQVNSIDRVSTLVGSTAGAMLRIDNNGSGPALGLQVGSTTDPNANTVAPMTVNSARKVNYLNADSLDGKDASSFLETGQKAADADNLDGMDSSAFLPGHYYVRQTGTGPGNTGSNNPGSAFGSGFEQANCDDGDLALGGGYEFSTHDPATRVFRDRFLPVVESERTRPFAWVVGWHNDASPERVTVWVACVDL
jgi:hypothetical protein